MDIKIRKANIEDLAKLKELNHRLFELEHELFDPALNVDWTDEKSSNDYLKNIIKNQVVFLAIVNNEIVGYLAGSICSVNAKQKLARLDNVFILEDYRNYGVGSELINKFKIYSLGEGMENIEVTTFAKNKNAISFYLKNGFEELNITFKFKI
jgi:ribosomal protein S18 acetylase RimI-like enzyme